ncbi:MAG: type 1 glutamine amidotransferase [Hyphomicrobium sp.]
MLPRVVILQHSADCHPGTFAGHLAADGITPTVVKLDQGEPLPNLDLFDILMVMGGPMNVWDEASFPWLKDEKAAIRTWVVEHDKPFLGICLGHQLLADALGGEVGPARVGEINLLEIALNEHGVSHPLYSGFGKTKRGLQWHGAEVKALPPGAVVLASTSDCPIAAFAYGSSAFGLQYHVEATDQSVVDWSLASQETLQRLHPPGHSGKLRTRVIEGFARAARQLSPRLRQLHADCRRTPRLRLDHDRFGPYQSEA